MEIVSNKKDAFWLYVALVESILPLDYFKNSLYPQTLHDFSLKSLREKDRSFLDLHTDSVKMFGTKKEEGKKVGGARLDLPKIRRNPLVEIIAINTGCLNQCTYCKTRHARGELGSYSPEEIVARAEQSFNEGVCEIWLTSEDTGAYGRDIGTSLPELLWKLVEVIPEGCR